MALSNKEIRDALKRKKSESPSTQQLPAQVLPDDNIKLKIGRLGADEKKYIRQYCEVNTDEEIAAHLHRSPETVRNYRMETLGRGSDVTEDKTYEIQIINELRKSYEWSSRKNEFTDDEMRLFEQAYADFMKQFKDDITATEHKQIFQAIELEIKLHRSKRFNYRAMEKLDEMRRELQEAIQNSATPQIISEIDRKIQSVEAALQSSEKTYNELSARHGSIIKDLKGTREQRIQKYENSKKTIFEIIRELEDINNRRELGVDLEAFNLAKEKEYKRLGSLYQYRDKTLDRPIKNSETIDWDE
jgi:hypothetical protein